MTRLRLPLICECLLFFVPLNIYGIGNHLTTGVQWALFRYQQSIFGNSLILIHRDLMYVQDGILQGSSACSTLIWLPGVLLLVAALILLVFAAAQAQCPAGKTRRSVHRCLCCALFGRDADPVRTYSQKRPRLFPSWRSRAHPCHRNMVYARGI